jgi:hypothetical protein
MRSHVFRFLVLALSLALFGVFAQFSIGAQGRSAANTRVAAAPTAQPVFLSGVYAVTQYLEGSAHPARWTLTVTGGQISGRSKWDCCPGSRTDPLTGTAQGAHVVIVRDCTGQGSPGACTQTFSGDVSAGGSVGGTWAGKSALADGTTWTGHGTWTGQCTSGPCAGSSTTTTPTTTPGSAPVVRAYPLNQLLHPVSYALLPYSVTDASGKAKVHGILYQDGTPVAEGGTKSFIAADGRQWRWKAPLVGSLTGPLYFCVWAENPDGKQSAGAPNSSCAWLSMLVDIAKVSNGCGGDGLGSLLLKFQNWVGNTQDFYDRHWVRPAGRGPGHWQNDAGPFRVTFVEACNLHDAGYGGQTVTDVINGGRTIDYRTWSRKQVDEKFRTDMIKLCQEQITGPDHVSARTQCEQNWRYEFVRDNGSHFFDADLRKPGTQAEGPRDNS